MLNSLQMVGNPSFSQPYLCIEPTIQSLPKIYFSTSVNFYLTILPWLVILTIPTNTPFLYTSAIFHLLLFAYNHPKNLLQNIFPLPQLIQGIWELESLVSTNIVLISPFFLEVGIVITGLTITDSLLIRFRELVYCRCGKLSHLPSLIPQPIVITSIPY